MDEAEEWSMNVHAVSERHCRAGGGVSSSDLQHADKPRGLRGRPGQQGARPSPIRSLGRQGGRAGLHEAQVRTARVVVIAVVS